MERTAMSQLGNHCERPVLQQHLQEAIDFAAGEVRVVDREVGVKFGQATPLQSWSTALADSLNREDLLGQQQIMFAAQSVPSIAGVASKTGPGNHDAAPAGRRLT